MLLEIAPIIESGPAWFAVVGIVTAFILNVFKEYVPIIGKKIDVDSYKTKISELETSIIDLKKDLLLMTEQLTEKNQTIARLEGWFFAMREQLNEMGASDIVDLINKRNEGNT